MTIKYVDGNGGRGWTTAQAGTSGDPYKGAYGLQKAFDTVAAGDSIYLYAPSTNKLAVNTLVLFTVASTASYAAGDAVQNNTGGGNHWTATVCEVVDATHFLAELQTGTYGTVTTSEGVANTTRSTTTTCSAASCPGILDNTTAGTDAAFVELVGTSAAWAVGTRAYITGGTAAHVATTLTITRNNRRLRYLQFDTTSSHTMSINQSGGHFHFCRFTGSTGGHGLLNVCIRAAVSRCEFDNNFSEGCYNGDAGGMRFNFCKFHHNGGRGLYMYASYYTMVTGCWSYKNTLSGFECGSSGYGNEFWSCVSHGNGGRGIYLDSIHNNVFGCRITLNTLAGLQCTSDFRDNIENWNYFQGNSTPRTLVDTGAESLTGTDSDYGYTSTAGDDYSLVSGATGANIAVSLDFAA